jgi:hypothetical protein
MQFGSSSHLLSRMLSGTVIDPPRPEEETATVHTIRRLTSWFVIDDIDELDSIDDIDELDSIDELDELARMRDARDRAVRAAGRAEARVRDLGEALDSAEALLRQLDRMTSHYRRGWQMGAPFVEFDDGSIDPATLAHPALGGDRSR